MVAFSGTQAPQDSSARKLPASMAVRPFVDHAPGVVSHIPFACIAANIPHSIAAANGKGEAEATVSGQASPRSAAIVRM